MCAYLIPPLGRAGPWWRTCCSPDHRPTSSPLFNVSCFSGTDQQPIQDGVHCEPQNSYLCCDHIYNSTFCTSTQSLLQNTHLYYIHLIIWCRIFVYHLMFSPSVQVTPVQPSVVSTYNSEQRCKIVHVLKTHFVALRDRICTFLHSSRAISPTLPPQCDKSVKLEIQKCSAGWSRVAAHQTLF